ncbi:MAG: hypothetical protein ACMXYA_02520 [Candidatus Woesearchaeota archaeon]
MVILFDQFNLSEDIFEVIFATEQQIEVAKMLIEEFKKHNGELNKTQMSEFATALHDGMKIQKTVKIGVVTQKKELEISYNKRQFYDRILTPMKSMGLVDFDLYKKTYRISEKFGKVMQKVANMWVHESSR